MCLAAITAMENRVNDKEDMMVELMWDAMITEKEVIRKIIAEIRSQLWAAVKAEYGADAKEIHITIDVDVIKEEGVVSVST